MFRVTCRQLNEKAMTILPEGTMSGRHCDDLVSTVERVMQDGFEIELDLAGLQFVDTAGLKVLRTLSNRGIALRAPSPFVLVLLNQNDVRND